MDLKVLKSQWDRAAAIAFTAAGALCFVLGYAGVADSAMLAEQTRYIVSGGIGGVFLLGLGATLWISADLRDEWIKLDRLERALADGVVEWRTESAERPHGAGSRANGNSSPASVEQVELAPVTSAREHA